MTTRADLLHRLEVLADRSLFAPCVVAPDAGWTSDLPTKQRAAAALCSPCPALVTCGRYADSHPTEIGVYGARTQTERHKPTRRSKTERGLT